MDVNPYVKQQLARLRAETDALCQEVQSLRRTADLVNALLDVFDLHATDGDLLPLLNGILQVAEDAVGAEESSLLVYDEDNAELVFVAVRGSIAGQLAGQRLPLDAGVVGWAVRNNEPAIVNAPYSDDRFFPYFDESLHYRTRTILAVPVNGGGRILGVIELLNKRNGLLFDEDDQCVIELLGRFTGHMLHLMIEQDAGAAVGGATG